MKEYNLLLDDNRTVEHVYEMTSDASYMNGRWIIAQCYEEFIACIEENGLPSLISYDHDLGLEHIKYYFENGGYANPPDPSKANFTEKTGYDCAKWVVSFCIDNKLELPKYKVHSKNPIGKQNIISYLENYIKHSGK